MPSFAQKLGAIHDRLRQQRTATRPFSGLTGIQVQRHMINGHMHHVYLQIAIRDVDICKRCQS
jgi:hypothetical protein